MRGQDRDKRKRRPASAAELASRAKVNTRKQSEKQAASSAAAAAGRATLQQQLLGGAVGASSSDSERPEVVGEVETTAPSTENPQTGTIDADQSGSASDVARGLPAGGAAPDSIDDDDSPAVEVGDSAAAVRPKRRHGDRGKDSQKRKEKRCKRCVKNGRSEEEARGCPGRSTGGTCKFFDAEGNALEAAREAAGIVRANKPGLRASKPGCGGTAAASGPCSCQASEDDSTVEGQFMTTVLPAEQESAPQPEHGYTLGQLSYFEYTVLSEHLVELRNNFSEFCT